MVLFVQKPYVAESQQIIIIIFFSLCSPFPHVVILFSSSRSVSAYNWVTLMGHDMCAARLLPCCSSDSARQKGVKKKTPPGSCCCRFSLLSQHLSLPMRDASVHPASLPSINPYPSVINYPPAAFTQLGLLWKEIRRVGGGPCVGSPVAASDEKRHSLQLGVLKRRS